MNIMIMVASYPPRIDSAARLYSELADALKEMGHSVTVITERPNDGYRLNLKKKDELASALRKKLNGVRVFRVLPLSFMSKIPAGKHLRFLLSPLLVAARGLLAPKPDAVLVYSPPLYMGMAGYLVARLNKASFVFDIQDIHPKVLIDMGYVRSPIIARLLLKMESFIYQNARSIIVYSKGNKDYLTRKGVPGRKVEIIPNWVDTGLVAPSERINGLRSKFGLKNKFIVTYAGTMGPAQQLETVVEAAEILKDVAGVVFLFVGDGVSRPLLQRQIDDKRLSNVIQLPAQPQDIYLDFLYTSDICLLPLSKDLPKETVPGKLAEIMACGRAVIACVNPDGEAAKVIEDAKCGYCVKPGDSAKLAQVVLNLCRDKEGRRRFESNGRKYAEQEFSAHVCIGRYEEVLFSSALVNPFPEALSS